MRNQYSFTEIMSTCWSLLLTKIADPKARLIRRPIYMRGRGSLDGGKFLTTGHGCRFDLIGDKKTLFIGNNCEMGDMTHIVAHEKVEIGDNVLIASKCFISDTNHGVYKGQNQDSPIIEPNKRKLATIPVKIGNNVWIGENVVILAGTQIGDGCIIGANAVVSGFIEEKTIAVGIPARVVKKWSDKANRWEVVGDEN